jgi:alpha-L-rhamnosidase
MAKVVFVILSLLINFGCLAQVSVSNLLCENRVDPLGIGVSQPQFTWQLSSDQRNVTQTAYEIRVCENAGDLGDRRKLVWNTGKVFSDASVHVPYNGKSLESGQQYFWQVRVWDNKGNASAWSPIGLEGKMDHAGVYRRFDTQAKPAFQEAV